MLAAIARHRLLLAEHLHWLCGNGASLRVIHHRLRLLWAAGYLDRIIVRPQVPGERDELTGRAVYCLARRGAATLGPLKELPHTVTQNLRGFATLHHHLVATDLLVAAEAIAPALPGWTVSVLREEVLRRRIATRAHPRPQPVVVPDAVLTISGPAHTIPQSFAVEVVRAGAKGGNGSVIARLQRYRRALRAGSLRALYGLQWLRSVLILTPTERRARQLAAAVLAADIPDSLVRLGWWQTPAVGAARTRLSPARFTSAWLIGRDGRPTFLLPEFASISKP